jgi:hypothetical protein
VKYKTRNTIILFVAGLVVLLLLQLFCNSLCGIDCRCRSTCAEHGGTYTGSYEDKLDKPYSTCVCEYDYPRGVGWVDVDRQCAELDVRVTLTVASILIIVALARAVAGVVSWIKEFE